MYEAKKYDWKSRSNFIIAYVYLCLVLFGVMDCFLLFSCKEQEHNVAESTDLCLCIPKDSDQLEYSRFH